MENMNNIMLYCSHALLLDALKICVNDQESQMDYVKLIRQHAKNHPNKINRQILNVEGDIARDCILPSIHNQMMIILHNQSQIFEQADYVLCKNFADKLINLGFRDHPDFETVSRLADVCAAGNYHAYTSQSNLLEKFYDFSEKGLCEDYDLINLVANWGDGPSSSAHIYAFISDRLSADKLHQWAHQNGVLKKEAYLARLHYQLTDILHHCDSSYSNFLSGLYRVCCQLNHLTGQKRWSDIIDMISHKIKQVSHAEIICLDCEKLLDCLEESHNDSCERMPFDQFMQCLDQRLHDKVSQLRYLHCLYYTLEYQISSENYSHGLSAQTKLLEFLIRDVHLPVEPLFAHLYVKAISPPLRQSFWYFSSPYLFQDKDYLSELLAMKDVDSLNTLYAWISMMMAEKCHPDAFKDGYLNSEDFLIRLVRQLKDTAGALNFNQDNIAAVETIILLSHNQNDLWGVVKRIYPNLRPLREIMQNAKVTSIYDGLETKDGEGLLQILSEVVFSKSSLWDKSTWMHMDAWINGYQKSHDAKGYNIASWYRWNIDTLKGYVHLYNDMHPDLVPKTNLSALQIVPHYVQAVANIHWSQNKSDRVSPNIENVINDGRKMSKLAARIAGYVSTASVRIHALIDGTSIVPYFVGEGIYLLPSHSVINNLLAFSLSVMGKSAVRWMGEIIKSSNTKFSSEYILAHLLSSSPKQIKGLSTRLGQIKTCMDQITSSESDTNLNALYHHAECIADGLSSDDRLQYIMQRSFTEDTAKLAEESEKFHDNVKLLSGLLLKLKQDLTETSKTEPVESILRDSSTSNILRGLSFKFEEKDQLPTLVSVMAEQSRHSARTDVDYSVVVDQGVLAVKHIALTAHNIACTAAILSGGTLINSSKVRAIINSLASRCVEIERQLTRQLDENRFGTLRGFLGLLWLYYFPKTDSWSQKFFSFIMLFLKISNPIGWFFLVRDILIIRKAEMQLKTIVSTFSAMRSQFTECFDEQYCMGKLDVILGHLTQFPDDISHEDKSILFRRVWLIVDQLVESMDHLDALSNQGKLQEVESSVSNFLCAFKDAFNNPCLKRMGQNFMCDTTFFWQSDAVQTNPDNDFDQQNSPIIGGFGVH